MTPTQVLTLGLLAVAWLAVAFPLAMRSRGQSVSGSVTGFHNALSVLDPKDQVSMVSAEPHQSAQSVQSVQPTAVPDHLQMLRRVLVVAVAATVVAGVAAVAWQGVFIPLAAVSGGGTVGYVGLLRRRKVEQDRARAVITSMRSHAGLATHGRQRHRSDRPVAMPRAVGHDAVVGRPPAGGHSGTARHAGNGGVHSGGGQFRDVRLVTDPERISAHQGFDVLT